MSQEEHVGRQPAEPDGEDQPGGGGAVRYGDVFSVEGELASTPIAPQDAALMQAAESAVLGQEPMGGAAAAMQSAARRNERLGVVAHDEATDAAAEGGVAITEARVPGGRVVTEFVTDQPVRQQYIAAAEDDTLDDGAATEASELGGDRRDATTMLGADKDVEREDAARVVGAEERSDPDAMARPGGVAASIAVAAALNRGRQ